MTEDIFAPADTGAKSLVQKKRALAVVVRNKETGLHADISYPEEIGLSGVSRSGLILSFIRAYPR